jgi:hypothetical protein
MGTTFGVGGRSSLFTLLAPFEVSFEVLALRATTFTLSCL